MEGKLNRYDMNFHSVTDLFRSLNQSLNSKELKTIQNNSKQRLFTLLQDLEVFFVMTNSFSSIEFS